MTTEGASVIDNFSFNYVHSVWDYRCADSDPWRNVGLMRQFRSRDITKIGSFGPGFFCNYDLKLLNIGSETPCCFDPGRFYARLPHGAFVLDPSDESWNTYYDYALAGGYFFSNTIETGEKFTFELVADGTGTMHGRLVRFEDSKGYGQTITYKTWTTTELAASPTRVWQIDHVTDDLGETISFTYGSTQVGGMWAVSQIDLPNGESITYTYDDDKLSEVSHPDGTTSTFDYSATSTATVMTMFDAAGDDIHRSKTLYFSLGAGTYELNEGDPLLGTACNLVRMVVNGEDEVKYYNFMDENQTPFVYEGGNKLINIWTGYSAFLKDGWSLNYDSMNNAVTSVSGDFDNQWQTANYGDYILLTDERGIERRYDFGTVSGKRVQTKITYDDTTTEKFSYNSLKRMTRHKDRLGRVTLFTYDTKGNMLTKEVGLVEQEDDSNIEGYTDGYDIGYADGTIMDLYDDSSSNPSSLYNAGYVLGYAAGYYDGEGSYGYQASYSPPAPGLSDVETDEHAVYEWQYYGSTHAHAWLLAKYIDPNGNETDYTYDSNHRLDTITFPPDVPMGTRADRNFTYDSAGRLSTVTEPGGWGTSYEYDERSRLVKTEHADNSTERFIYGTGVDANLLVKYKDRSGSVTKYEYDDSGRKTKTIFAYATMDLSDSETLITDAAVKSEETYAYLAGTSLVTEKMTAGDLTEYEYDYRHRLVSTITHPNTNTDLESTKTYVDNKLFCATDPYGRKTYYAYDVSDGRLIRMVRCTVPSVSYTTFQDVLEATRAAENAENPTALITDFIYDAQGQLRKRIDPRGVEYHREYDSRGRVTAEIFAAQWMNEDPTDCVARTEYDYDAKGNKVAIRFPRYFDVSDTRGYNSCIVTMTYTGRNLLKSRTEADGAMEEATTNFSYNLDGRQTARADFNGKTWTNTYGECCGRLHTQADPLGNGIILNRDGLGRVTHQAWVSDISSHSSSWDNPIDAKTLKEVTTKYDARGRVSAQTVWLTPLGIVDADDVPIYTGTPVHDSASPPSGTYIGLTTMYTYDDDLDDSTGLDSTFSGHLTGLNLGDDSDGSAVLQTAPDANRTLTIRDGNGRTTRFVQLDSSGNAVAQSTQTYDAVVTVSGYGDVVETTSTNLANHSKKRHTDGAGRTIATFDGDSKSTTFKYNANGNRLKVRDPNAIGQDCAYDALGRDTSCIDTASHGVSKQFDLAGNLVAHVDARTATDTFEYDARNRRLSHTDRNDAVTVWTYDNNGKTLSVMDSEDDSTTYSYDDAGRLTTTTWPDHVAMTSPGDTDYGITAVAHDAMGRVFRTTDQKGDTITTLYDLAGRATTRAYRTLSNSPSGTIADQDSFTYNAKSQLLTATRGRYGNTVTFTYSNGRKASEALTIGGQTYTVSTSYNNDGLVSQHTYPDSTTVGRTYNARGLLSTISYGGGTIDSRTYDDGGRLTSESLGNGLTVTTSYENGENLIASIANTAVGTYSYDWDDNHNKTAETITGAMANYGFTVPSGGYDDEDRLVEWNRDDSNLDQEWSLSDVGDWDTFTENGTPVNRTHGNAHELTAIGSSSLTYDSKGNLTQDDTGRTYNWDMDNMLASTTASSVTVSYAYDAFGRRASRTASGSTTVYVSDGQVVLAEYTSGTASSSPLRKYINASYIDEPVLLVDRTTAGSTGAGSDERLYYHRNQQYSITALTDNSGGVVERYNYTAYGQPTLWNAAASSTRSSSDYGNTYMHTARAFETDTGLHYYRARYLQSRLGRFISRDPLGYVDGLSLMAAYFLPGGTDPKGLAAASDHGQCIADCYQACDDAYPGVLAYPWWATCVVACEPACRDESMLCGYLNSWSPGYNDGIQCICGWIALGDMAPSLGPATLAMGALDCACSALAATQNLCKGNYGGGGVMTLATLADCFIDYQQATGARGADGQLILEEMIAATASEVANAFPGNNNKCTPFACNDAVFGPPAFRQ